MLKRKISSSGSSHTFLFLSHLYIIDDEERFFLTVCTRVKKRRVPNKARKLCSCSCSCILFGHFCIAQQKKYLTHIQCSTLYCCQLKLVAEFLTTANFKTKRVTSNNIHICKIMVFLLPKNIVECIEKKTAHKTKESYRSSYDKKSHCFKISQISQIIFAQSWVNCMGFFHFVAWHFKWMSYYNVMDSAIVAGGGVRGNWLALRMCIGGIFRISARGISKKGLICIFSLNNCAVLYGQQKAIKYR